MDDPQVQLGGRLALLGPDSLSEQQSAVWKRMEETLGQMSGRFGFVDKTAEGHFIGPFNSMLYSPALGLSFVNLQVDESKHTSLDDRVRQVVILSVGSLWKSDYELYAHAAVARSLGFSEAAIEAISQGHPSEELPQKESLAQSFTLALITKHRIEDDLYRSAVSTFGEKGILDLVILAGCYHIVCGVLNAFAIPKPK